MSLSITLSFINSMLLLEKKIQKYTLATIRELENNPQSDSLKIHKIDKTKCDSSFRSARVNDDIRIIFANRDHNEKALLYVDHHEDAYKWCEGKFLKKTSFGAEMIYDEKLVESSVAHLEENIDYTQFFQTSQPLLATSGLKGKNLETLGVPEIHAANLLKISDEDQFLDYIQIFPEELQEALLSLVSGEKTFDEIYNELVDDEYEHGDSSVHRDTKRRFYMLQSLDELEAILASDNFEAWTVFLHPSQEKLVRMNFRGPALIEGGPGTGKTVVGIHRALYLAQNIFQPYDHKQILFCTFSKKLARFIDRKLDFLAHQKNIDRSNVVVSSVDSFLYQLYQEAYHVRPNIDENALRDLMRQLYDELKPSGSFSFYWLEYTEIIERTHIETQEEYLSIGRIGGSVPLSRKQREYTWRFLECFLHEKKIRKLMSFVDMAYEVLCAINTQKIKRLYDSIIIDEAQDLQPIKIRALASTVRSDKNNVFILSDANQRIFRLTSWKKDSGINIVGRTHYLSINYRTTKQISDYARLQFNQSEIIKEHIKEYKSIYVGEPPQVVGFSSDHEQRRYITELLPKLEKLYPAEQICIICPTNDACVSIESVLQFSGFNCSILKGDMLPSPKNGICICPVNGVKGLEFRCVIIYDYNQIEGQRITSESSELVKSSYIKLAECAKYVAATRARDELIITYIEKEE